MASKVLTRSTTRTKKPPVSTPIEPKTAASAEAATGLNHPMAIETVKDTLDSILGHSVLLLAKTDHAAQPELMDSIRAITLGAGLIRGYIEIGGVK